LEATPELLLGWLQDAQTEPGLAKSILDKLFLVSFENERQRDPQSAVGPTGAAFDDLLAVCFRLQQAGYAGLIRLGQPSQWKTDSRQRHRARAYSAGYLRGVLQGLSLDF
jgi:hypothetical protein